MNDGSNEPQEQDNYSTSSSKKNDWFWASVEVHIQNSENELDRPKYKEGA